MLGGLHRLPFDLLNQFAPTPGIRRSRNTFEENDLEDEADQLTDLDEYGSRSRRRVFKEDPEDESDPDIDVIAGLPSMSSSQSLLDRQFRPPLDITCNYNLDMVSKIGRCSETSELTLIGQRFGSGEGKVDHSKCTRCTRVSVPYFKSRSMV